MKLIGAGRPLGGVGVSGQEPARDGRRARVPGMADEGAVGRSAGRSGRTAAEGFCAQQSRQGGMGTALLPLAPHGGFGTAWVRQHYGSLPTPAGSTADVVQSPECQRFRFHTTN